MTCRWDSETQDYLLADGTPCRHDRYGDPTRHCTARRRCNTHVGSADLTCHACITKAHQRLTRIEELMALMPAAAIEAGWIDSEAMTIAAATGDPVVISWRRIDHARATGGLIGDDTPDDPATTLGRWQQALAEDYGDDLGERVTAATAIRYLKRTLAKVAQDPSQDFAHLLRDLLDIRQQLERVLATAPVRRRGLPCPWCAAPKRLIWVEGPTMTTDWWRCPDNRDHTVSAADYDAWAAARRKTATKTRRHHDAHH